MSSGPVHALPLAGLRVVDLSRLLPGPYASLVLADLGAEVIKVESTDGGDYLRYMPPLAPAGAGKASWAFTALNAGKRSLCVDLKRPEGVDLLRRLTARADILLESFRPGVMDRLGLGYEALAATNPGLVYCALTGFGQTGPYRDAPGHDLNYAGLAGALGLGGFVDRPPPVPPIQVADIGGSLWALVAILAAIHARQASGRGRFLDVSMTDGVTGFLAAAVAPMLGAAAAPPKRGAEVLTGSAPCYGVYQTEDARFMTLAALEPKFWSAFCGKVARPEWLKRQFDPSVRPEIEALFASRPRAAWEALFAGSEACCEPVLEPAELADHPLHQARHLVIETTAGLKRLRTPVRPVDAPAPGPAPGLGEHTRAILGDLGYTPDEIQALAHGKVVVA